MCVSVNSNISPVVFSVRLLQRDLFRQDGNSDKERDDRHSALHIRRTPR